MGLLQNGYRHNLIGKIFGATALDGANPSVHNYWGHRAAANRNQFAGQGITDSKAAVPNGNLPSSAWIMPRKAGGMSSRACYIALSSLGNGLMGMPTAGTSVITVSFSTAAGQLIASGVGTSSIVVSGNTSQLVASLSGTGTTGFVVTGVTSLLGALSSGIGSSSIAIVSVANILPENDLSPLRDATASFSFSGELSPYAVGSLSGEAFLAGGAIDEFAILGRMEYDDAVHIHVLNGQPGTKDPIGTRKTPVNNLTDALVIAEDLNLNTIIFLSDYTLESGDDVSGYTLKSSDWRVVTVSSGAITTDTIFAKLSVYGELSGTWNTLIDCWVYNVTNFLGWVRGGSVEHIELAPYLDPDPYSLGSSYFDDIVPMYAGITSVLICNTAVSVSFTNCIDIVEIRSMESGVVVNVALNGGEITLASSCLGGTANISGIGLFYDNSTGVTVETGGLINYNTTGDSVWSYAR